MNTVIDGDGNELVSWWQQLVVFLPVPLWVKHDGGTQPLSRSLDDHFAASVHFSAVLVALRSVLL